MAVEMARAGELLQLGRRDAAEQVVDGCPTTSSGGGVTGCAGR
jgi:hypothetical protein